MQHTPYSSEHLDDIDVTLRALSIIRQHLDGLPVGQARRILRQADMMMDATSQVNCAGEAFQQACEGFQAAGVQSR